MIHKSEPTVLVGEASTCKAKGKRVGCWKKKKGKGKVVAATASAGGFPTALTGKSKGKVGGSQRSRANDVLERSRKLSKDEMILRLGNGNAVAAEAMGFLSLVVSDHIQIELKECFYVPIKFDYDCQTQMEDNHENAQLWYARLGHISKDRIRKLVNSKSLESIRLDHTDVCGPLNTPARGGFSYFITFTDEHSRYGYVYLIRYKFEAFLRFKEYRLEVENQTGHKIKALRSDRGGEYLSGEFIDYLKENENYLSVDPLGTPQLNGVAKRRN
ncbi:UNVERIFIED_CONTAM: Transposon Ty1-BL Gag-Pol polyprotein [Sesamum radiatum]|uniref:Transposon Ty1-BL Gag-Pol polyprotein n=1 Tax=Sesamum radiatum TaxID=300843 RepID=A0AAW2S1W8_SESRA